MKQKILQKLEVIQKISITELYDNYSPADKKKYEIIKAAVFYFDPNTISSEDWRRLGVRDKTITTIQKYLSKGGRFKKPEDIAKIWGLSRKRSAAFNPLR